MNDSKKDLILGASIIDHWMVSGGIGSQDAMIAVERELIEWLASVDKSKVQCDWLDYQDIFALWSLIEIELDQCPPKELRDLVFSMRGEHQLWFGKLLFALAIYLYESKTTPQKQEGVRALYVHAIIWSEIMLLHSVLTAYSYNPEPEKFMGFKFGLTDYQKLDLRLKSNAPSMLPGVTRLLEELKGVGDPAAEFLLGLQEDHDYDLVRDTSDCGFVLASYYGALKADNVINEDSSAWNLAFNKQEKETLLRRITLESVGEYLGQYEAILENLSKEIENPVSITEEDWIFFSALFIIRKRCLETQRPENLLLIFGWNRRQCSMSISGNITTHHFIT